MSKTRLFIRQLKSVGFVDAGACEGSEILLAKRRDEEVTKAVPTAEMAQVAERALKWRQEYGRGGTEVGVARARDISNRRDLSPETIGRMVNFFSRHESASKGAEGFREGEPGFPSPGRIAWDLWGGDPGAEWAARELERIRAEKIAAIEELAKAGRKMAGPRLTKLREIVTQLSALLSEVDDESADDGSSDGGSMSKQADAQGTKPEAQPGEDAAAKSAAEIAATHETQKRLEVAEKQLAEANLALEAVNKRVAEAEETAKAERDARLTAEWIEKAKPLAAGLPIDAPTLGVILKRAEANALTDADRAELVRVLKAASEAVAAGKLFAEIGKTDQSTGSAAEQIAALAVEYASKNGVSAAVARNEIRKSNPELAARERAERK